MFGECTIEEKAFWAECEKPKKRQGRKRHSREWYAHCRYTYAQRKAWGRKMQLCKERTQYKEISPLEV